MVSALLTSLVVAVTFTPALAELLMRHRGGENQDELAQGGRVLRLVIGGYEWMVRRALRHPWLALACVALVIAGGVLLYDRLETDFLPKLEEGAFVLDYYSRPGTSLSETDRMLRHVEKILLATPEVESFSRRTGARLALAIAEPNTGDFLVKLRPERKRSTEEVINELREQIHGGRAGPAHGVSRRAQRSDRRFDVVAQALRDQDLLQRHGRAQETRATEIAETIGKMPGVVDVEPGLVVAGPSMRFAVRPEAAARVGLTPADIGNTLQTSLLGRASSYLLQGDRTLGIRVLSAGETHDRELRIRETPIRSPSGNTVTLNDLADVQYQPGILEMHREDLRQLVAVSARFAGMDLGTGIRKIRAVSPDAATLGGHGLEFGGLYQQQQESFKNLTFVLLMAIFLVFAVLLMEFRSIIQPWAIVLGAVLALFGVVVALALTGTSLNIVSFLGAIIGVGIVAKNGILMLDFVEHLQARAIKPNGLLQAELLALVQTYRFHQTATYRREKLRVARQLAEFNEQLVGTIRRQAEAAQAAPADLVLAEVENQSMRQRLKVADQQYLEAITDLRKQIGLPEYAGTLVPTGSLTVPESPVSNDEEQLTRLALAGHPDIQIAAAQANASHAAVALARAERIPLSSVGPIYALDETGTTFYGLAVNTPVPILNPGRRLVWQRETEHQRDLIAAEQTRVRIAAAVKASLAKWLQTQQLVADVVDTAKAIEAQTQRMERLYTAGQTDLLKLLQVRQRLIDAENARLDMLWQATQAYADLLSATGTRPLLGTLPVTADEPEAGAEHPPE